MVLHKIYHVSDIHIRNGDDNSCRYSEYSNVFNRLFASISSNVIEDNLLSDQFVIVVSGDIFHNKNVIGNYGLALYKQFIEGLTAIGTTILFHGNHDRNQNEANQPSLIASTFHIPNLILLNESTSFVIQDTGFSYVSIDDTLDTFKTSGRIESLPSFPNIVGNVKHKVALFHGTFANVKLNHTQEAKDYMKPYPFEWLDGFDYAILGDIHLRQKGLYNDKTLWGYAGSLIQQNHGEDILLHGYMIWDLNNKTIKNINIPNDFGFLNLKQDENQIITIKYKGVYVPLEEIILSNRSLFPTNVEVKLFSNIDFPSVLALFNKYDINFNIINNRAMQTTVSNDIVDTYYEHINDDMNISVDKNTIIQHFSKHLSPQQYNLFVDVVKSNEKLLLDVSQYPEDMKDECIKKNKEITTLINNCSKSEDVKSKRQPFTIKYLEWDNLYCYEGKNWIDFSKAETDTFLISGNNGTGKSAIYDIMTLALWGDITPMKQNVLSNGIINYKHDKGYTIIDVFVSGQMYRISREFVKKEGNSMNKRRIYIYKYISDCETELLKADNACNDEIKKLFGSLDEFLAASMITQNGDFDILKMSYKDCVAVIDKATNIDYIYSLYDLFKGCINKYKDVRKVITSKKQVYDRLISSMQKDSIDESLLLEHTANLQSLENQKDVILNEINSIAIDISCLDNKSILDTDFHSLIAGLGKLDIENDDQYKKAIETFNELKVLFKNTTEKQLYHLSKSYNPSITLPPVIVKPCEYELIEQEENAVKKYQDCLKLDNKYSNLSDTDLTNTLNDLKRNYDEVMQKLNELNDKKPITVSKPLKTRKQVLKDITSLYNCDDSLLKLSSFCSSNSIVDIPNDVKHKCGVCTFDSYTQLLSDKEGYTNEIIALKESLRKLDEDFNKVYEKQNKLVVCSKPTTPITLTSAKQIHRKLSKFTQLDIEQLRTSIKRDEAILETFYKGIDDTYALENELKIYQSELELLNTNDEYKYNPDCEFCCKRSWVSRIKELHIIINGLQASIQVSYDKLYCNQEYDFLSIYQTNEANIIALAEYDLYRMWYDYYMYKEKYDAFSDKLNSIIKDKKLLNSDILRCEEALTVCSHIISSFNILSHDLYNCYKAVESYESYETWKQSYDDLIDRKHCLYNDIETVNNYLTFRPRIQKLELLKSHYRDWKVYDDLFMIVKAHDFFRIKSSIEKYELFLRYQSSLDKLPAIKRKIELFDNIKLIDVDIKNLNDILTKYNTIHTYNYNNDANSKLLSDVLLRIDNLIMVFETIIDRFKIYRKEIYNEHILKHLLLRTNKYIQTLCHSDTKKFELDYIISEVKDVIHINWLIRNINHDNIKQVISVNQASGFQQFVISLSLRMSLFSNKKSTQLFFDEGFTACDKINLSIVPSFLKGLLHLFDSVIIASHIDIIQQCVDTTLHISFDNHSKSSSVSFGPHKDVRKVRKGRSDLN